MNVNENVEAVKVPAFDDATIAALMAEKQLNPNIDVEVLIQTDEDFPTDKEVTVH